LGYRVKVKVKVRVRVRIDNLAMVNFVILAQDCVLVNVEFLLNLHPPYLHMATSEM